MKKLVYLLLVIVVISNLSGCIGKDEVESIQYEDSSDILETIYEGNNGWNVSYYEQFFDMNELSKGQNIELIYKGKCKGSAYVEIAEVKGKTAKELIEENKSEYESTSDVYDIGKDRSGYVFYVPDIVSNNEKADDRSTTVEIIDLNDAALVITASQMTDDEMEVSDRISDIFNSIEIRN